MRGFLPNAERTPFRHLFAVISIGVGVTELETFPARETFPGTISGISHQARILALQDLGDAAGWGISQDQRAITFMVADPGIMERRR